jgi:hypothetical protein
VLSFLLVLAYLLSYCHQDASREIVLGVNAGKTKRKFISHDQIAGQCCNVTLDKKSRSVVKFKYFRKLVKNTNSSHKENESSLNLGNSCYSVVHSLLYAWLLSKNMKIKIQKCIILPVALYWCKNWSLTLSEKHRLREFENKVLSSIFRLKMD